MIALNFERISRLKEDDTAGQLQKPLSSGTESSPAATGRKGFTLVELLVVIAIIAILIAILFPVILSSVERGKAMSCMSNLKQLGVGLTLYLADHGKYPGHHTRAGEIVWPHKLRQYLGNNHHVFRCPSLKGDVEWPVTWSSTSPHSNPLLASHGYYEGEASFGPTTYIFSYGYNDWGAGPGVMGLGASVDDPDSPVPGIANIAKPAQMYAIGDTTSDGIWDTAIDPYNSTEQPSRRHNGGSNMLFVDGHVENVPHEDLVSREDRFIGRWNSTGEPAN